MKTRLLKKIRRDYSIEYDPSMINEYLVRHNDFYLSSHRTLEQAVSAMLKDIRFRYAKYSRNYVPPPQAIIKVWYK